MYLCARGIDVASFYDFSNLGFGNVPTVWYFFSSSFYWLDLIFGVLTPLSAIFQLYHGDQF